MRVLVITPEAYGGYGGIAQLSSDLTNAMASAQQVQEVRVLTRHPAPPQGKLPEKVHLTPLPFRGKLGFFFAFLGMLAGRRAGLVVCTHIHLLPFAALAKRRWGARLVLTIHGLEIWNRPRRFGLKRALRFLDWVFSVSEFSRNKLLAWAPLRPEQVLIHPCCVDLDAFSPGEKDEALLRRHGLAGKRVLLVVARLAADQRSKGIDQVLDVLPALAESEPGLVFAVAGKGDDRARLETKAASLGVVEKVRFLGYVVEEEKPALYRSADAFVLASRGEGFGIVLLEAAASGLPIVASKLDASQEVVTALGEGQIVDPDDPEDLKAGIRAALASSCGRRPKNLDAYGWPAFERRVHAFLGDIATERAP